MTQTTLEIVEEVKTNPTPPLKHAYCNNCMMRAAPLPIKAKCGGGNGLARGNTSPPFLSLPPAVRCVVCEDLKACPVCGLRARR